MSLDILEASIEKEADIPSITAAAGKAAVIMANGYPQYFVAVSLVVADEVSSACIDQLDRAVLTTTQDIASTGIVCRNMRWTFDVRPGMQELWHLIAEWA